MNPGQRVLLVQLQLAGLGLIIAAFGFFEDVPALCGVGAFVFLYGVIRFFLFKKSAAAYAQEDISEEEARELMEPPRKEEDEEEDSSSLI